MPNKTRMKRRKSVKAKRSAPPRSSCLVRVSGSTKRKLEALQQPGETCVEVMDQAVELLRRQRYFEQLDAKCAAMTPAEWEQERKERQLWDRTLADGNDE